MTKKIFKETTFPQLSLGLVNAIIGSIKYGKSPIINEGVKYINLKKLFLLIFKLIK